VAVAAAVVKDGMVLLIKRKYPPSAGKWSFPGGYHRRRDYQNF